MPSGGWLRLDSPFPCINGFRRDNDFALEFAPPSALSPIHQDESMPLKKTALPTSTLKGVPEPHDKGVLTSRLGRVVEGAAYVDLLLVAGGILLLGSFYYLWIPEGNGLASNGHAVSPDFFEALYFCIVTFTTLGYGDLSPIGMGRLAAALIVISGLIMTALLIGKFASERQQSTLLLLYTSDAQRRLEGFTVQIKGLRTRLERLALDRGAASRLHDTLQSLENLVEATFSYTIFNANQARLAEFGNTSALKALYRELANVQGTCVLIHKLGIDDVAVSDCSLNLAQRLSDLMNIMVVFHRKKPSSYASMTFEKIRSALLFSCLQFLKWIYAQVKPIRASKDSGTLLLKKKLRKLMSQFESRVVKVDSGVHVEICKQMNLVASDLSHWAERNETPAMLLKVLELVPPGAQQEWSKDLNSQIGRKLKITNTLARQCILSLREQGRLPKV
ncbi:potassium channel family protein [Paraburkholderia sediminicola]|uniref:potassium channel family protein n=1 Tax=Paraburkholderia sediminicola TaxID=458836 RepID=UPI0038B7A9ED